MAFNTILLKGDPLRKEGKAGGAITPGHLIVENSSGNLVVHPTAGGNAQALIAIEDALQGKEISGAYAANNRVQYVALRPGDEFYAILTTSQTIAIGDFLESNGDGTFRKHTPPTEASNGVMSATELYYKAIVARAREAKTTTGTVARIILEAV